MVQLIMMSTTVGRGRSPTPPESGNASATDPVTRTAAQ
jgi:hypothetical protein